jgi:tetratricopeptide (TPR) repeat protein
MKSPGINFAFILALILFAFAFAASSPAPAEDAALPEIPQHLPNPFKKAQVKPVSAGDDLKRLEEILYGEVNEGKTDESRLSALERTVFGSSSINLRQSLATRVTNLKNAVARVSMGRKLFAEKRFKEARDELSEAIKLLGKDWKSLVKAEVYYRLGMCEYELSNISQLSRGDKSAKANGALIRSSRDNLMKSQDYYRSLGQAETAQKIGRFADSFKEQAATYFLY